MIDVGAWKEFTVSELFITEQHGSSLQVPTGAMMPKKDLINGDIPRVTVSNFNNGITGYYADSDDKNYRTYENFISVSFLGTVFYQPKKASLDMKVHCLKPVEHELNEYSASFIATIIRKTIMNYKYVDQLSSTVLANLSLKLPATSDGQPDWQYMEDFMKQITEESEKSLEDLTKADNAKHKINVSNWGVFNCGDLFECKNTGNILARDVSDGSGDTPYVTASSYNNGVVAHIDASNYEIIKGSCILVGGKTFTITYQKDDFVSNDSHNFTIRVKGHDISEPCYLFLASMLYAHFGQKYSWNDAVTKDKLMSEKLPLPITATGEPDWRYMEDSMGQIMLESEQALRSLQVVSQASR